MTDQEEEFWRELRRQLAVEEAAEHAAAEQLLADLADTAETMDPNRIEALVAQVTQSGNQPSPGMANQVYTATKPARSRRWARTLTLAAAISLAPGLLIATAFTGNSSSQLMLRDTVDTLDYRDAIGYLVDANVDANSRNTCQGHIATYLKWSAKVLQRVLVEDADDPVLWAAAQDALYACRHVFANDAPFSPVALPESIVTLVERIRDRTSPSAVRTAAVMQLGVMMEQGATAFLEGLRTCSDEGFRLNHEIARRRVVAAVQ